MEARRERGFLIRQSKFGDDGGPSEGDAEPANKTRTPFQGSPQADTFIGVGNSKEEAMKWMLFVLVFGTHPVETNLLFDTLDACLKAEETMRTEYARAYSQGTWGTAVGESNDPSVVSRYGQRTTATCIPHA